MSEQTRKAVSYAFDFLTFLFLENNAAKRILSAYIFGSAVRGELDKGSDVDIFINCNKIDEDFVLKAAESAKRKFASSKDFDKWRGLGFSYPISIKAGPLAEWELRHSIASEGFVLFSKTPQHGGERVVIYSFDLPKDKKSYLKIRRKLFGRAEKNYMSEGIVTKHGGKQLASDVFIVPKMSQGMFIKFMHANKIKFTMTEFSSNPQ